MIVNILKKLSDVCVKKVSVISSVVVSNTLVEIISNPLKKVQLTKFN